MTSSELIREMKLLPPGDLLKVLREVLKNLNVKEKSVSALLRYKGIGAGVWKTDAQVFVKSLRDK